jgi:hypothetical protein
MRYYNPTAADAAVAGRAIAAHFEQIANDVPKKSKKRIPQTRQRQD